MHLRTASLVPTFHARGCFSGHMVDWRWLNDKDEWQSYDDCTIEKIEQAYKGQEGKVKVSLGRWNYEVDLTKVGNMTQTNLETKTVRKVKREKLVFSGKPKSTIF